MIFLLSIDPKAYIIRIFIDNFMFVFLFYMTNTKINKKKYLLMILMTIIRFVTDLFIEITEFIPIICGYYILRTANVNKITALNKVLSCSLFNFFIFMSSSVFMNLLLSDYHKVGFRFIFLNIVIDYLFAGLFIYLFKKLDIEVVIEKYSSKITAFSLLYIVIVINFISYVSHKREIFDQFVLGILIFLVLQTLFVSALFIWMTIKQKERYEQKIKNQQTFDIIIFDIF